MKSLRGKQLLVMGGALFSMHFGASCMLYPMTWGKESGSAVYLAYAGVFLSGILITLLGYTALSRGNDSFWGLTKRIAPRFGTVLCSLVVLLVGPVYVIPRMSASAWDAILQLLGVESLGTLPVVLFNLVVYGIIFWFIAGKVKVTDRIGKILRESNKPFGVSGTCSKAFVQQWLDRGASFLSVNFDFHYVVNSAKTTLEQVREIAAHGSVPTVETRPAV